VNLRRSGWRGGFKTASIIRLSSAVKQSLRDQAIGRYACLALKASGANATRLQPAVRSLRRLREVAQVASTEGTK